MRDLFKKFFLPFSFLIACTLLYGQLFFWHFVWLGWILFFCYLWLCGAWWQVILDHVFGLKRKWWMTKVIAGFAVTVLLASFASTMVAWYRLTPMVLFVGLVLCGVVSYGLALLTRNVHVRNIEEDTSFQPHLFASPVFSKRWIFVFLYGILWIAAFYFLFQSRNTGVILSPWQAIHSSYPPLFFAITLLAGVLVFSFFNTRFVLLLVVFHALLLHLYLPLSHANPWGGDVWRHIAIENRIEHGEYILPVLFGPKMTARDIGDFSVPDVFFTPQKYAYGHLWGLTAALADMFHSGLIRINIWFMPILWSLVMPILLFRVGWLLFQSRRSGLFLAFLSFLPFSFQAVGSFTLPVSLGYLIFFFVLMLWLSYLEMGEKRQKYLTIFFAVLMLFGYPLHAIVMWFIILASVLIMHAKKWQLASVVVLSCCGVALLPLIELVFGVSKIPATIDWIKNAAQFAGQWSGWYYASQIRPHDIASGNIMVSHTPSYAFVSNIFTNWRWYIIPSMFLLWGCAVYGWLSSYRRGERIVSSLFAVLFPTVVGGYIISWHILLGDHLFARRLDVMVAFVLLIFFIKGIAATRGYELRDLTRRVLVLPLVLWLSWLGTATYASGPDTRVVSADEFRAAQYVWSHEQPGAPNHCVLADTWTLLPLESFSNGTIVGGGFPIDYQFSQPELLKLLDSFASSPSKDTLQAAHIATKTENCWVVISKEKADEQKIAAIQKLIGSEPQMFGDVLVWQEGLKKKPK